MTQRATPPPRRGAARAGGGQQRPPETMQMGDTTEREVRPPDGDVGGKPPIPIEDESFPPTMRSSVRLSGTRLSDLTGGAKGIAEARKGSGPTVVVLHNIVAGPGTRTTGALTRGKVVRLSAIIGDELMEALDPEFEPENAKERALQQRARKLLAHYTGGNDPAIREARSDEADMDTIVFAETEEEALKALEGREEQLGQALDENARLKDVVQQLAQATDDPAAISEILARAGIEPTPGAGRFAVGTSPESRLNPEDELPDKTGDEKPGKRDPGFMQQRPSDGPDNTGQAPIPPNARVERQGATTGQEPDTGGGPAEVSDEAFDPDEET